MKSFKKKLHRIIFGVDTAAGKGFDIVLLILIIASITILMLESVQEINIRWSATFKKLDWIITCLFTVEYVLRIWTSEKRRHYVFSFFGLIDLFSILPTYIGILISGTHALAIIRVLRLLRVFRVLKLVQFMGEASKLKEALRTSSRKIVVFLFFVMIVSVFLGTLMYIIEGREHGFTSIPRSIYWAIVTLTTVGYGDIAPQTTLGQILAMLLMITGYGVIAVPTGLVTAEFVRANASTSGKATHAKRACLHCGTTVDRDTAKFCSQCGQALPNADNIPSD
ncbi:MAG: ion transporter [Cyclobacteriaceae bacterium]|jgi:voltage-gated potassium channel|nr:ion transporter [Cyclobacteriaceae bacterium]MDH4296149.1 ion transporter [Cyclobacteriaceae bacterium]MDH5249742.1 ion transporter [Cyclobacteriaceae bacterium]